MVMVLPFIIALVAILCILRDRFSAGVWGWAVLMVVYLFWCNYHMTDSLVIAL